MEVVVFLKMFKERLDVIHVGHGLVVNIGGRGMVGPYDLAVLFQL